MIAKAGRSLRTARAAMVGEPPFKPAYGFDPPSPLGPKAETGEEVPGLKVWLTHLGLKDYLDQANEWCADQGAAVLEEVLQMLEQMAEDLELPPEDAERLIKRGKVAVSTLEQRGELVKQKPVVNEEFNFSGRTMLKRGKEASEE